MSPQVSPDHPEQCNLRYCLPPTQPSLGWRCQRQSSHTELPPNLSRDKHSEKRNARQCRCSSQADYISGRHPGGQETASPPCSPSGGCPDPKGQEDSGCRPEPPENSPELVGSLRQGPPSPCSPHSQRPPTSLTGCPGQGPLWLQTLPPLLQHTHRGDRGRIQAQVYLESTPWLQEPGTAQTVTRRQPSPVPGSFGERHTRWSPPASREESQHLVQTTGHQKAEPSRRKELQVVKRPPL